ncbi:hypothetical protein FD755_025095 [Muntiacus reevesi]|uniref:JAB1/MPN/MOV34 metalloenzyme domain-containing protein n=1 Tax=Muntiacus reevesi TaxID=9886 RepID=A0A5N3UQI2_MUNRE|nr:hypothetical protein FD755_025095 [Muntiacus reevesi]
MRKIPVDTVRIVHIHSVIILRRSDKRKDRVEISPEQLSAASTEAEISLLTHRLAELTGRPMRVVGWYHSHPHITVWPSHVGKYSRVAVFIVFRNEYHFSFSATRLMVSPGDLPDPGLEPWSPALQADSLPSKPPGKSSL